MTNRGTKTETLAGKESFSPCPGLERFRQASTPIKSHEKQLKNLHNYLIIQEKIGVKHLNFVIQNISVIHWWLDYGERKPITAPRETHSNPSQLLVNLPTCGQNRSQHQAGLELTLTALMRDAHAHHFFFFIGIDKMKNSE